MDLLLNLDESLPLHRQLRDGLKEAILSGRLVRGQKLPSSRSLAKRLGVSRTTVCDVYESMEAEGYLIGTRGSGTYVTDALPEGVPVDDERMAALSATSYRRRLSERFGRMPRGLDRASERDRPGHGALPFDFHPGQGAWDLFPKETWRRILTRQWRTSWHEVMDYGDPAGYGPLRAEVAGYLARSRAVECSADEVVIVNGTQQALDLLARVLLDPRDEVAVEEPGYAAAREVFRSYGATLRPVRVDADGMLVDDLVGSDARLVLVAPSHHYPTGATMSLPRRLALLRWASRAGAVVIEDDYDSEFRYQGRPLASLQGLDTGANVVYLGSFSKVLFPSLRIGYAVLPRDLVRPFVSAKELTDRQTPIPEQQVLADFIRGGHFGRHLRRMREVYGVRRDALAEAVRERLPGRAELIGSNAGMHVMLRLPGGVDEWKVAEGASRVGVGVYPAGPCYVGDSPFPALVMGYAGLSEVAIREGVKRLGTVICPK